MKTWGVVCTLLSGAILAVMLASMNSCSRSYEIDALGRLCKTETDNSKTPSTLRRSPCDWASELPQFPTLAPWTEPEDRIVVTETTAGLWVFEVTMGKVEVIRGSSPFLKARSGHVRFWSQILGMSLFPLICWGIAALWIVTLTPRRRDGG